MDEIEEQYVKLNKLDTESQIFHNVPHMWNLKKVNS
jgi:hypothetical protein